MSTVTIEMMDARYAELFGALSLDGMMIVALPFGEAYVYEGASRSAQKYSSLVEAQGDFPKASLVDWRDL